MREIDYTFTVQEMPGDQIRYHILTDRGRVLDFVVQYETNIDGIFRPVVRYDGSHGRGHRDILNMRGETVDKWWLPDHLDLKGSLKYGSTDLRSNWRRYRDTFLERYT